MPRQIVCRGILALAARTGQAGTAQSAPKIPVLPDGSMRFLGNLRYSPKGIDRRGRREYKSHAMVSPPKYFETIGVQESLDSMGPYA